MKHLLTLLLLLPAFCTATAGGTNIPGAILAGARTSSAPAGAINTGEETLQRLQLLACTEDELLEGYPEDRVDYSVKLRNPNAAAVTGELSLELFDTAGNYIGAPAGAYKAITLEAGEEQTVNLILFLPPSGEERRVSICFTPFEDTPSGRGEQYSFGYFDMRSKTVAEGAPRLSLVSAEPATPRFAAGGKTKAKVTIKNTGGYFSNTSYSQNALEYVILAKKINLNGTNLTNIPLYETESLGDQPVRIDKDETATVEIELGTEVFTRKQLSSIVKMYDPDFSMQPGEYFIAVIYRDETNNNAYTSIDLVPFLYEETEPNRLYAPEAPVRARTGTQVTLPVNMENPTGITGFQFDLHLPAGVTCATDGQGHPLVSLGDRTDTYSHTISAAVQKSGALRVLCYSTTNLLFDGNDGHVADITLDIAADAPLGLQQIRVDSVALTDPAGNAYLPDGFTAALDIFSYITGDANNDQSVNIADIPATASFILGNAEDTYCREAADANGDGNVRVDDISTLAGIIMQNSPQAVRARRAPAQAPNKVFPDNTQHSEGSGEVVPFVLDPGKSTTVTFDLNVPETELCGVQFDLYLPEGITVDKTTRGAYKFGHINGRTSTYTHTISSADRGMTDGSDNIIPGTEHIRVLCYSTTNEPFASHDGALISIPLTAAGDLRDGVHEIQLKNIIATTVKAVAWGLPDNRVSVLSGNLSQAESLPELQGHWTAEAAQALSDKLAANSTITSVSLVQATDIAPAAGIRTGNPNTLIYVPDNRTMANEANIVSGTGCTKLELTDGYPFHAPTPFTAAEATYSRQSGLAGWHTLCLPFAAETPAGLSVERFESLDEARHTVAFKAATGVSADTPCIFHTPTAGTVVFSATDAAIAATPATLADGALKAAYRPTDAGALAGKYVLNPDGTGFSICDATVFSPAFCAWLDGGTDASAPVYTLSHGNTPTGIEHATGGSTDIRTGRGHVVLSSAAGTTVSIVSVAGQTVRTVRLRPGTPQTVVLPAGVYLAGNRKFVIR